MIIQFERIVIIHKNHKCYSVVCLYRMENVNVFKMETIRPLSDAFSILIKPVKHIAISR